MKTLNLILVMMLAFCSVGFSAEKKSPVILLQEGIYAEETEGDLEKAIGLYEQVLAEYKEVERLAARATYQLGMCHLKKGDIETAFENFSKVIDYYPEQQTVVKKAQLQINKIRPEITEKSDPTSELLSFLQNLIEKSERMAAETGLTVKTIINYIDESNIRTNGELFVVKNDTQEAITDEVEIAKISTNVVAGLHNANFAYEQYRIGAVDKSTDKYPLFWTPSTPLEPGQSKGLFCRYQESTLSMGMDGNYRLAMSSEPETDSIVNFVVLIPENMKIINGLENLNSQNRIYNIDIYVWQEEINADSSFEKILTLNKKKEVPDAAMPAIAESFPKTYSNDVDYNITELSLTFDQDMHQYGWSWCQPDSKHYPQTTAKPAYINARTCVLPVKLEPGKSYLVVANMGQYLGFKNTDFIPAREFALVFATKDIYGNPTKISENLLEQAKAINKINSIPEPILDIVPAKIRTAIADHFRQTYEKAMQMGLRTNSHVHIFDTEMNRNFGMIQVYHNRSNDVMDSEIAMGNNDSPEMYIYDEKGTRQKIRTVKVPNSNYRFYWTPSEPIQPDEKRMLFYSSGNAKLSGDGNGLYPLRLQNHYGSPVIENFYVVSPSNIKVVSQSEEPTMHQVVDGFNIYCWSKEQTERNVTHRVDIKLSK